MLDEPIFNATMPCNMVHRATFKATFRCGNMLHVVGLDFVGKIFLIHHDPL